MCDVCVLRRVTSNVKMSSYANTIDFTFVLKNGPCNRKNYVEISKECKMAKNRYQNQQYMFPSSFHV